jgi:ParB-like chromosome segregation protein Spo0J
LKPLKKSIVSEKSGPWMPSAVALRAVESLIPYARNARTHSDAQVAQLAASIREFGWTNPVLVSADSTIIAGHGRVLAARQLGLVEVPCIELAHLTETQRRALVIADNKLALTAGWDDEALAVELAALQDDGFTMPTLGFGDDELAALLVEKTEGLTDPDEVPEVVEEAVSRTGDVWLLGRHRVACGDSADESVVSAALDGRRYDVTVVDPPYEASEKTWVSWLHDPCVLFGQAKHLRAVPGDLWRFERVIVKRYRHRSATVQIDHRHAFVAQIGSEKTLPHSTETFPSVVQQEEATEHDHQKPVGLLVEHLTKWIAPGWRVVCDPYLGSGTTVIAAEMIGVAAVGIEYHPPTCDVAIRRWQKFTGLRATLEGDGRTFDELAAERATP